MLYPPPPGPPPELQVPLAKQQSSSSSSGGTVFPTSSLHPYTALNGPKPPPPPPPGPPPNLGEALRRLCVYCGDPARPGDAYCNVCRPLSDIQALVGEYRFSTTERRAIMHALLALQLAMTAYLQSRPGLQTPNGPRPPPPPPPP
eukprot:4383168-Lingulodinium_polyedra.AAC.1